MKGFVYYAEFMSEVLTDEALEAEFARKSGYAPLSAEATEEERLESELFEALRYAEEVGDWDLYSDIYKDLYGVRPRW